MSEESDNTPNDADVVAGAVGTPAEPAADGATEATAEEAGWFYADGVAGTGDKPEFMLDKFKTLDAQAKGYKELESRFGSFTGAPEAYEVSISDELKEAGFDVPEDDLMMQEAQKFAKDLNMNQEGFGKMVEMYGMVKLAENKAIEEHTASELKALGDNGTTRINNLSAWGKANLSSDLYEGFEGLATTALGVQALERLVAMTRSAPVNPATASAPAGVSSEELRAMQFEKDEHGNRKLQTDPEFKARFKKLSEQVYGSEENRIIIG